MVSDSELDYSPGGTSYRRLMVAMAGAGFATFSPLYSPHGLLPLIGGTYQVNESSAALLISAGTFGVAIAGLAWSLIGDRIGRPKAMKFAMLVASLLGFVVIAMPSFELILGARFVQGLFLGAAPTLAMAYLAEQVPTRYRAVAAGSFVSGNTLGGLSGRIIAAPIGAWFDWRIGVGTVALISLIATVIFITRLPAPRIQQPLNGSVRDTIHLIGHHLKNPTMVAIFLQGFLLFGGFVALYNYLTFRLEAAPFGLSTTFVSLLFVAYIFGTVTSRLAGRWAIIYGRRKVITVATAVFALGVCLTLINNLVVILIGLAIFTGGFFAAQAIASGWAAAKPIVGTAQATSLYNMGYYAGSALVGWALGFPFQTFGWNGVVIAVLVLAAMAQTLIWVNRDLAE